MPIYAYYCEDCKEPFELFVRSMTTKVDAACPTCGGTHVEKEVTAPSALGGNSDGFSLGSSASSCAPSG
ncbi:MAG: zinc ribbon domain-containing protein [Chloroflexi bacterium]|nr:zinc ribbon domain-containing protein [Chloroflexota bacterium]